MTQNRSSVDVVKALIFINVLIYIVGLLDATKIPAVFCIPTAQGTPTSILEVYGAYSYYTCFSECQFWRLITYQFLHANLGHLVFNMVALSFFGGAVVDRFGPGRFLCFYLLCGIGGALCSSCIGALGFYSTPVLEMDSGLWKLIPLLGASASIYGVLVATAFLFPHARVQLLFPPIDMTVRTLAIAVLCFAVGVIVFNWENAGGEAGHLGGMIMGFLLMLCYPLWRKKEWEE